MTAIPIIRNLEAEQAVLGAMLTNNNVIPLVAARLKPEHFSEPLHAHIYDFATALQREGKTADFVTLGARFKDDPRLAEVGGSLYLVKLGGAFPHMSGVPNYADAVREAWAQRESRVVLDEVRRLQDNGDFNAAWDAQRQLDGFAREARFSPAAIETVAELGNRLTNSLAEAYQRGSIEIDYAHCALTDLAKVLDGWVRKRLYILAGRPGAGKSTVALSTMLRTALRGHGVMMFSLEMGKEEITRIALCDLAWSARNRVEYRDITPAATLREGFEKRFEQVLEHAQFLKSAPMAILEHTNVTVDQVRAQAIEYAATLRAQGKRLEVICIDHLGLLKPSGNYRGNKVAETEEVSRDLKALAKDMDCAVIGLAQLSRQVEGRDDKRPTLADLRWSGGIEQDADVVMFVFRESYYLTRKETDPTAETKRLVRLAEVKNELDILVAKNRAGPTQDIKVFCDIGCGVIRDMENR